jgi:hypothetical protein
VALQQLVASGFAEGSVTDHDRHDVAWAGHHRQAGFGQAALQRRRTLLMTLAFDLALFRVAYRGERGRQRRREDEPRRVADINQKTSDLASFEPRDNCPATPLFACSSISGIRRTR